MGEADTLTVMGQEHVGVYVTYSNPQAPGRPPAELRFSYCTDCGGHLFIHAPAWAGRVYSWATAIDTPLPKPPETLHINLHQAAPWVEYLARGFPTPE